MRFGRPKDERGAVMVMVALFLPLLLIITSFAIDGAHLFDFSRNLQNRADAAAFAAALEYGNTCFNSPTSQTGLNEIGQAAQQYSGPPVGTPDANLPYGYNLPAAFQPYQNQPNLASSAANYHLVLNGSTSWDKGGVSFEKGNFCSATYDSPADPAADVWVTQAHVPLFLPLLNFTPNISAHARVQLQGIQELSNNLRPIAVRDASFTPCVSANFLDDDGNTIATAQLTKMPNSTLWTSSATPTTVTPTGGDPVTVQLNLNNCSSSNPASNLYNSGTPAGLVYVDNWGTPTAPGATGAPAIAAGGVKLTGASQTNCDPYFETNPSGCTGLGVDANVAFQPGVTLGGANPRAFVTATVGGQTPINLTYTGTGNEWNTLGAASPNTFSIAADSGASKVTLQWKQTSGKVGANTCNPGKNNKCFGTIASPAPDGTTQQRVFAGLDGDNLCGNEPTNDTGPVQWLTIGTTDNGGATAGYNAVKGGGTAAHLYVTTSIEGLSNAPASATAAQDICLRLTQGNGNGNNGSSHATGLINCGQGNGTPADQAALENGCPNPVQVDTRVQSDGSLTCTPTITPQDCVQNDPGESPPILRAFDDRIGSPNCSPNNWPNVQLSDPRTVIFILVAPTDLLTVHGTADIPIRGFAVFYVTGWSTGQGGVKGCSNGTNDPAPPGSGNGQLWGHFTSIAVPSGSGTGNGTGCNTNDLGDCIAVLTR